MNFEVLFWSADDEFWSAEVLSKSYKHNRNVENLARIIENLDYEQEKQAAVKMFCVAVGRAVGFFSWRWVSQVRVRVRPILFHRMVAAVSCHDYDNTIYLMFPSLQYSPLVSLAIRTWRSLVTVK